MSDTLNKKLVQEARQVWRLCAAAEWAYAKFGYAITAKEILKAAGMSRRSMYEHFRSVEHLHARMTWAADEFDRTDAGVKFVECVCPSADFMLCAQPLVHGTSARDMSGTDFNMAYEARAARVAAGPEPVPTNIEFLLWYAKTVLAG